MQETGTAQPLDSLFHVQGPLQNWPHDTSHRDAEALVLIRVEVHAVDTAGRRRSPGIEELAVALFCNGG
jgi:hypothetical protein